MVETAPVIQVVQGDLPDGVVFADGIAALDTETTGLNVTGDKLCVCQVGDGRGNVWLIQFPNGYDAPNLKALLQDPRVVKVFHFARFDVAVLQHNLKVMVGPFFCTKIASKLLHEARRVAGGFDDKPKHNLRGLVLKYCGIELDKTEQMSNWNVPELTESQKAYAASDVLYLHTLYTAMLDELAALDLNHMMQEALAFLRVRVEMDVRGFSEGDVFAHK
ncbi:MAG: ribonuclease D [Alphaproteobacteria bacterium]